MEFLSKHLTNTIKDFNNNVNYYNFIYSFISNFIYDEDYNNNNNNNLINSNLNNNSILLNSNNLNEIKIFFDINSKIFSSSELKKYYSIYEGKNIDEICAIFKNFINEIKNTFNNNNLIYLNNTDDESNNTNNNYSDNDSSKNATNNKNNNNNTNNNNNNDYRMLNDKILNLKKFEFNFKISLEILKNYLVAIEIPLREVLNNNNNNNVSNISYININNREEINKGLNILYNLFEDGIFYRIDEMEDDIIFNRRFIQRMIFNHKEYLSIIYDI